jgi:hypothetical protein
MAEDQIAAMEAIDCWIARRRSNWFYLSGEGGTGKRLAFDAPILTPEGFRRNGDLRVGDLVIGGDGQPTAVAAIYDSLEPLEFYRLDFNDGTFIECCKDHLWQVSTPKQKEKGKYQVLRTEDLIAKTNALRSWREGRGYYSIPLVKPIDFSEKNFSIDPYLLGFLLGDGCFAYPKQNRLTVSHLRSDSSEIKKLLCCAGAIADPHTFVNTKEGSNTNYFDYRSDAALKDKITGLGLWNLHSGDRFIPAEYLLGSIAQRLALVQGLMDSDGTINVTSETKSHVRFCTTSPHLAEGLQSLIRSLGGRASISSVQRQRLKKDGNLCGREYTVSIQINLPIFRLSRKLEAFNSVKRRFKPFKKIVNITLVDSQPGRCISVANADRLYVTKDYIVTHNTTVIQAMIRYWQNSAHLSPSAPQRICLASSNDTALAQLAGDLPDLDARTIHSLMGFFPSATDDGEKALYRMDRLPIWDYDLIVLDEAPTVPAVILDAMNELTNVRWLCLGDLGQLPPVKELVSSLPDYIPEYSSFELYINKRFQNPELTAMVEEVKTHQIGADVPIVNNTTFLRSFLGRLSRGEDAVFLAYRNVVVDKMTDLVRSHIYDLDAGALPIAGEKILMKMLLGSDGKKLIANNTLCEVLDCTAEFIAVRTKDGQYHTIGFDVTGAIPAALKSAFSRRSAAGWAKYHRVFDSFPRWRSPFSKTVHSAQGSTSDYVYIDWSDIQRACNCPTMPYVAVSRAREELMFR